MMKSSAKEMKYSQSIIILPKKQREREREKKIFVSHEKNRLKGPDKERVNILFA